EGSTLARAPPVSRSVGAPPGRAGRVRRGDRPDGEQPAGAGPVGRVPQGPLGAHGDHPRHGQRAGGARHRGLLLDHRHPAGSRYAGQHGGDRLVHRRVRPLRPHRALAAVGIRVLRGGDPHLRPRDGLLHQGGPWQGSARRADPGARGAQRVARAPRAHPDRAGGPRTRVVDGRPGRRRHPDLRLWHRPRHAVGPPGVRGPRGRPSRHGAL
ncbi:MAG: hypothetical protein AVDCRST_MAG68-4177, partial [uncultured Gemmatimonadetes bacterium]